MKNMFVNMYYKMLILACFLQSVSKQKYVAGDFAYPLSYSIGFNKLHRSYNINFF